MRHDSLHIGQVSRQQVLPSNHIARRDVISPLIRLHLHQQRRLDGPVNKPNVPVIIILCNQAKIQLLTNFHQLVIVLTIEAVQCEGMLMHIFLVCITTLAHKSS